MKNKVQLTLIFFICMFLNSSNSNSLVFINEALINGVADPASEWIEIFNSLDIEVNLSNWSISEKSSKNYTFNTTIPAKGFLILSPDMEVFNSQNPGIGNLTKIVDITGHKFSLSDKNGFINLYDSVGNLADTLEYSQASGKKFENITSGKYPDGNNETINLLAYTPGTKNDNLPPKVKNWTNPTGDNETINGIYEIIVEIEDDTTKVESVFIDFNGTNYSMNLSLGKWTYLWNTSLNKKGEYNLTFYFTDNYKISDFDILKHIKLVKPNILPNVTNAAIISTDYLNRTNGSLQALWDYEDKDGDLITNYKIDWFKSDSLLKEFNDLVILPEFTVKKHEIWKFSVKVYDGSNWSESFNGTPIRIQNFLPEQFFDNISINKKDNSLYCNNFTIRDLDNDSIHNYTNWYKNEDIIKINQAKLNLSFLNASKDDKFHCEVTPFDFESNGTSLNSTYFNIINSPPILSSNIKNIDLDKGKIVTLNLSDHFVDLDNDNLTYNHTNVEGINISIDQENGLALFFSETNFNGKVNVVFYASDGENLTKSNNLTFTVNEIIETVNLADPQKKTSSSGGGNSFLCTSKWNCSNWSGCIGEFQSRECIDLGKCVFASNKPKEILGCKNERKNSEEINSRISDKLSDNAVFREKDILKNMNLKSIDKSSNVILGKDSPTGLVDITGKTIFSKMYKKVNIWILLPIFVILMAGTYVLIRYVYYKRDYF